MACGFFAIDGGPASADVVRLPNGGEVRGVFEKLPARDAREKVAVRTRTGGLVEIARTDVAILVRRPAAVEEYETRRRHLPHTVEAHWTLAEWCRAQRLKPERTAQLEALLEIEPDHQEARQALGHVLHQGRWMTPDDVREAEGFVRYKGRWVFPQELEILEKNDADSEAEKSYYKKVAAWNTWLHGTHAARQGEALAELRALTDPHAVPAVYRALRNSGVEAYRQLLVEILERLGGPKAAEALVWLSLYDGAHLVRRRALDALPSNSRKQAIPFYVGELRNTSNAIVRRAASALAEVGDEAVVPMLIEALVTRHVYQVQVRVPSQGIGMTTNGQTLTAPPLSGVPGSVPAQLPNGIYYPGAIILDPSPPKYRNVNVPRDEQNPEVLAALKKFTGEDFGYDERTWRLWWAAYRNGDVQKRPPSQPSAN